VWPTVLSAPLVNLDLIMKTFATLDIDTSAKVPVSVPRVPRSLFILGFISNSRLPDHCLEISQYRNSRTTGSNRFRFGVWGQYVADCTLVVFGEL
jgi:hypothetical protein